MTDYPVLLNLEGRLCVVIGAGPVGLRKVRGLVHAGARVRLVATEMPHHTRLQGVELGIRSYQSEDLEGATLVFAATDDPALNLRIADDARARRIPACIADNPARGDFTLPARLEAGDLHIAVSTAGRSPALAAAVRDHLGDLLGPEWHTVVEVAAALRQKQLTQKGKTKYNRRILRRLIDDGLPALIAAGDVEGINQRLTRCCGEGVTLATLGINLPKGMT